MLVGGTSALLLFLITETTSVTKGMCSIYCDISNKHNTDLPRFCIRSVSEPSIFWYYDPEIQTVVASRRRRTNFTITIADSTKPPGTVMIGTDNVVVRVHGTKVNIGNIDHGSHMGSTTRPTLISFSSFRGNFSIEFGETVGNRGEGIIVESVNGGEHWELV